MPPAKKARVALASALLLLLVSGFAVFLTITRLVGTQELVIHTHDVQMALRDVDSTIVQAGRARKGYVMTENESFLRQFESALPEVSRGLNRVRELTRDNPKQQERCAQLEEIVGKRIALLQQSVDLDKKSPNDDQTQASLDLSNMTLTAQLDSLIQQMREEEDRLLRLRRRAAHRMFLLMVTTMASSFLLAIVLIAIHHRLLSEQVAAREQAERIARENEESLRRLTVRMLQMQDAERRKFSRELHDSLGQGLLGAKMNLEMFATRRQETLLAEAIQLLEQAIAETRTISHLLHPPLLDEAGLSSAAKWYLEEFSRRSGIEVNTDRLEDAASLPRPIALGLFRILQESLVNIHRHSESTKAEVAIRSLPDRVILEVRDFGKGISPQLLNRFQTQGTNAGVGIGGMHERTRELGGQLHVERCKPGTLVSVTIPLPR
jgi:signal transduction histidine kinase